VSGQVVVYQRRPQEAQSPAQEDAASSPAAYPASVNLVCLRLRVRAAGQLRTTKAGIPTRTLYCEHRDGIHSSRVTPVEVWLWRQAAHAAAALQPGDEVLVTGKLAGVTVRKAPGATEDTPVVCVSASGLDQVRDLGQAQ